jgi:hypothetical protein
MTSVSAVHPQSVPFHFSNWPGLQVVSKVSDTVDPLLALVMPLVASVEIVKIGVAGLAAAREVAAPLTVEATPEAGALVSGAAPTLAGAGCPPGVTPLSGASAYGTLAKKVRGSSGCPNACMPSHLA